MLGLLQLTQARRASSRRACACTCQRRVKSIQLFSHAVGKYIKSRLLDNTVSVRHFRRRDTFVKPWSSQK